MLTRFPVSGVLSLGAGDNYEDEDGEECLVVDDGVQGNQKGPGGILILASIAPDEP